MFVIEAVNERGWRWISAICSERAVAEAFLSSIPLELLPIQRLREVEHVTYPLFVIEDRGFEYGNAEFVRERLAQLQPSGNEDNILLNVYIVRGDFTPPQPGEDSMGELYHWHITDDSLEPPRRDVIYEELHGAERDAV